MSRLEPYEKTAKGCLEKSVLERKMLQFVMIHDKPIAMSHTTKSTCPPRLMCSSEAIVIYVKMSDVVSKQLLSSFLREVLPAHKKTWDFTPHKHDTFLGKSDKNAH